MGYSTSAPPQLLVPRMGSGVALWVYKSNDAHGDVDGSAYFTNAAALGMKEGDVVIVVDADTATTTLHTVSSTVTTITAATLS